MNRWHVARADADAVLEAAWELGSVRMGHILIETHTGAPHWWWTCCCGVAAGFAGLREHTSLALAGFMTKHRFRMRLAAWDREETRPIAYQIDELPNDETWARGRR
jgi:hypothetical protein